MSDVGKRILVVDDDRAMTRTLCDVLQLSGWEAESAASGEEAVQAVASTSFTAVLMDVRMGGISGVDALRAIRDRRPGLPVILMTAYSSRASLRQAEEYGVTRVFAKPLPIDRLLDLLGVIAEGRRALLLVDDDRDFLRSLSTVLAGRGYDVIAADSLEAALAHLRRRAPPVVLLDLKLDDHDPREVIGAIRQASGGAAIVVLSGHASLLSSTVSSLNDPRVVGHLLKPFAPDALTRILDGVYA